MPRDKTDTHNKLLPCIKQEFLEHGYEKASMQNIARRAGITAAVWTKPEQADLQWIQAEAQEDGSYLLNINVPGFGFTTGNYYVDIYLTDINGNQYLVAQTTGFVE